MLQQGDCLSLKAWLAPKSPTSVWPSGVCIATQPSRRVFFSWKPASAVAYPRSSGTAKPLKHHRISKAANLVVLAGPRDVFEHPSLRQKR